MPVAFEAIRSIWKKEEMVLENAQQQQDEDVSGEDRDKKVQESRLGRDIWRGHDMTRELYHVRHFVIAGESSCV